MKVNKLITAALVTLGLVSSASAFTTLTGGSGTTNVVFMTGSTAFRGNIYNTVTNNSVGTDGTLFDTNFPVTLSSGSVTGGTSSYWASGKIGGNYYLISFNFTGSEAGIASVAGVTVTQNLQANPTLGLSAGTYTLPNATPTISFSIPGGSTTVSPDLTMADTSQAVSLTKTPTLTEYGIVGVVNFVWAKGKNSSPDASWTDLVNVSKPQLGNLLSGQQNTSYFTGNVTTDTDPVYLIGRNKGSGTRVNTFLDLFEPLAAAPVQYALNNSTYTGGKLAFTVTANNQAATYPNITSGGANLVSVGADGFESGGGVSSTLSCDLTGSHIITLGYLGINDALAAKNGAAASGTTPAQPAGAVWMTLDGYTFNDGNIEAGTYTMWGHEHLYGTHGQTTASTPGVVALRLAGTTAYTDISDYQNVATHGAIEACGLLGGGTTSAQDNGIDPAFMACDKSGDTGYPQQL